MSLGRQIVVVVVGPSGRPERRPPGVEEEAGGSTSRRHVEEWRIDRRARLEDVGASWMERAAAGKIGGIGRIARETGARTGPKLYSDALSGPDGPAGTYIAMVRHNIRAFSEALSR